MINTSRLIILSVCIMLIVFNPLSGLQDSLGKSDRMAADSIKLSISQVKDKYTDSLMKIKGVSGLAVGQDKGKDFIVVLVEIITADIKKQIPKKLEGYPVKIDAIGEIKALPKKKKK